MSRRRCVPTKRLTGRFRKGLALLAKLIALMIHEVVSEYRKLSPAEPPLPVNDRKYDVASTTAVMLDRPDGWDLDTRMPITAADITIVPPFGFRSENDWMMQEFRQAEREYASLPEHARPIRVY